MAPKEDSPPLILRVTARGIIPAAAIDAEIIAGLTPGSDLSAKLLHMAPSKALRAWWFLMGETVKLDPERFISARALSNHILLAHNLTKEELLIGGARLVPMSLTDFTESDLWRLVEVGKRIITCELVPGLDCDLMLDEASKRRER